jgi:hypothetical protein
MKAAMSARYSTENQSADSIEEQSRGCESTWPSSKALPWLSASRMPPSAAVQPSMGSVVSIADLGQSPQDGFTEYAGCPGSDRAALGRLQGDLVGKAGSASRPTTSSTRTACRPSSP